MAFQKKLRSSAWRRNVDGHGSHGLAHGSCRGQAEQKPTIWETEERVTKTKEGVCNCVCSSLQMRKKTGPLAQSSSTKPGARQGGGFLSSRYTRVVEPYLEKPQNGSKPRKPRCLQQFCVQKRTSWVSNRNSCFWDQSDPKNV